MTHLDAKFKAYKGRAPKNIVSVSDFLSGCLSLSSDFLYRGQGDSNWNLVPSAFRNEAGICVALPERTKRLAYFSSTRFGADFKRLVFSGMDSERYTLAQEEGSNQLTKMMLFQHFGIPTPLLDWTESPLVSLFMAFAFMPKSAKSIRVFRLNHISKPDAVVIQRYKDIGFDRISRQLGGVSFIGQLEAGGKNLSLYPQTLQEHVSGTIFSNSIQYIDVKISDSDKRLVDTALKNNGFSVDRMFPNSPHWTAIAIASGIEWS